MEEGSPPGTRVPSASLQLPSFFVHELSREIIGKGSYLERGSTTARVNGVQPNPIKLIIGKDCDELPGLEFRARHIHREASAILSPALAQATTPSAEATFIGPSRVADVARPERVKLQPVRPERPGPRMQSCLARSGRRFCLSPRPGCRAAGRPASRWRGASSRSASSSARRGCG
jgi:hypothetical protein